MRLVYKKFADGTYKLYQTDDRGGNERVLDSTLHDDHKVRRVKQFIEVNCDDDEVQDSRSGLNRVMKELERVQ